MKDKEQEKLDQLANENGNVSPESHLDKLPLARYWKNHRKGTVISLLMLILLILGSGYYYYERLHQTTTTGDKPHPDHVRLHFYDVEEMVLALQGEGKNARFLRLNVTLEIKGDAGLVKINKMMPKIRDVLQVYLSGLRSSDLRGSFGLYKLRSELQTRINAIIYPTQIEAVLFIDIVIQ